MRASGKGILYWDLIPEVFALDAEADYLPCPFAGDAYQWMRNAVLALALRKHWHIQTAAIAAFAEHPTFQTARKAARGLVVLPLHGGGAINVNLVSRHYPACALCC